MSHKNEVEEPEYLTVKFVYHHNVPLIDANILPQIWVEADVMVYQGTPMEEHITLYLYDMNDFDVFLSRKENTWVTDSVMDAINNMAYLKAMNICSFYEEH